MSENFPSVRGKTASMTSRKIKIQEPNSRGQTPNRNVRSPKSNMMSVKDMVSYIDGRDESSYLGPNYKLKLWDHDIDKPRVTGFHKDLKPRHFMDPYMKSKKGIPGPGHYPVVSKTPLVFK